MSLSTGELKKVDMRYTILLGSKKTKKTKKEKTNKDQKTQKKTHEYTRGRGLMRRITRRRRKITDRNKDKQNREH